jgi:large subunit ribosomal protein L17e
LKNAVDNAKSKGLNTRLLRISSIAVNQARSSRRRLYRAHGRINSFSSNPCHIHLILEEVEKRVAKPENEGRAYRSGAARVNKILN